MVQAEEVQQCCVKVVDADRGSNFRVSSNWDRALRSVVVLSPVMFSGTLPSLPITGSDSPAFFSGLPAGVCPQPTTAPSNKAISVSLMADPRIHQADQSISLLNDSLLDRDREHAVTVAGQGYWAVEITLRGRAVLEKALPLLQSSYDGP